MPKNEFHALIIDDSRALRTLLGRMLTDLGFRTSEAANGLEGLAVLAEHDDISIALVDWNMPVMDGLEFVNAVRADSQNDGLQLMMVTTESELARVEKAMTAGANEYVMKPITKDVIANKLKLLGLVAAA